VTLLDEQNSVHCVAGLSEVRFFSLAIWATWLILSQGSVHTMLCIMATRKRTTIEREEDLARLSGLHRMGYTQQEIAAQMGLNQSQISRDFAELTRRWRAKQYDDQNAEKQGILAEARWIKRQAREEYIRSRGQRTKERTKRTSTPSTGKKGAAKDRIEGLLEKEDRLGDPRYLAVIENANKTIRTIRGMDAPRQTVLTGGGEPVQVKVVEVIRATWPDSPVE
jgi:hypothetical protein